VDAEQQRQLDHEIDNLQQRWLLLNRIRDLESERQQLQDGHPCPLCGAVEHPYARGNVPTLDATAQLLQQAKHARQALQQRMTALQKKQSQNQVELEHNQRLQHDKQETIGRDEALCRASGVVDRMIAFQQQRDHEASIAVLAVQVGELVQLETLFKDRQQAATALLLQRHQSDKLVQQREHRQQQARQEEERLDREWQVGVERAAASRAAALRAVAPFGIDQLTPASIETTLARLTERRRHWQQQRSQQQQLADQITQINHELQQQQLWLEQSDADINGKRADQAHISGDYEQLLQQRQTLFGSQDPDQEQQRLDQLVQQAQQAQQGAQTERQRRVEERERWVAQLEALQQTIHQRLGELQQLQQIFHQGLLQAGFDDEADYQAACLSEAERCQLGDTWQQMQQDESDLTRQKRVIEEQWGETLVQVTTDQPLESLQRQLDEQRANYTGLLQRLGALADRLVENRSRKAQQQEKRLEIDNQKRGQRRWQILNELIGSADGKKYRNFAQGLTFEALIRQANRQLSQMSDRYLLVRDPIRPLELGVMDHYQADEVRSTRNLSGGESFIVSLSLALGLSRMASRNVRVDSLFLDEGFGTLDEEALETALNTLAGLRQEGKLIGVISHVAALRERISTQIQVIPQSGGRSRIQGPGCRRVGR
ncbi:MAG: hypothetical protein HQL60_08395, partial [Magnetococcales bacterium]|nr:hypothetical protein [Magnetococcales bacterium]